MILCLVRQHINNAGIVKIIFDSVLFVFSFLPFGKASELYSQKLFLAETNNFCYVLCLLVKSA